MQENREYHGQLVSLAESLGLTTATAKTVPTALAVPSSIQVLFLLSIPGAFKTTLLRHARLLVYTPTNEHFGIVPVEAMHQGTPVLASNTGGPLETVVDGETGWLRDVARPSEWTDVMRKVLLEFPITKLEEMGRRGKERVRQEFSRTTLAARLEKEIMEMQRADRRPFVDWRDILLVVGICGSFVAVFCAAWFKGSFSSKPPQRDKWEEVPS